MIPQVFTAVCKVTRPMRPASLPGYRRYQVRAQTFPGIVPDAEAVTNGCLIGPIDAPLWQRLDDFESDFYTRETVQVAYPDGSQTPAQTYIVAEAHRHALDDAAWSKHVFERTQLDDYLARFTQ